MRKKILSLFLALILLFSILPTNALALEETEDTGVETEPVVSTEEGDTSADPAVETVTEENEPSEEPAPEEEPADDPAPVEEPTPAPADDPAPAEEPAPAPADDPAPVEEPAPAASQQTLVNADGNISVSGVLPNGAALSARQIANPFLKKGKTRLKVSEGLLSTAGSNTEDISNWTYLAFYDIKLVDENVNVQPDGTVTVTISNFPFADTENLKVLHVLDSIDAIRSGAGIRVTDPEFVSVFQTEAQVAKEATGEDGTVYVELLDASRMNSTTIQFKTNSFSIYIIIDDGGNVVTPRRTYHFKNRDGSDYEFLNQAGRTVTYQIVKTGDSLEDVGVPSDIQGDETFSGWFLYDEATDTWGEKIEFGEPITVTETEEMTDYYVYPYYGHVYYVDYYETTYNTEGKPGIILTKKQYAAGTTVNLNDQTVTAPDAELAFIGWSKTQFIPTPYPDNPNKFDYSADTRIPLTDEEATFAIDQDIKVYPIFKQAHWVHFISAPVGSGATYVAPIFVLGTQTTAVARPNVTMTWTGYTFQYWTETPTVVNNTLVEFDTPPAEYQFNESLLADKDLYAYWEKATTDYTVQFYRQVSTDAVNADPKNYEYIGSVTRQQTVGEQVSATAADKNGTTLLDPEDTSTQVLSVPAGFTLNESKSVLSATVKADGSTIIAVYFDRIVFTLAFTVSGSSYNDYYLTDSNTVEPQYAYVDGRYVQLTKQTHNETAWYFRYVYNAASNGGYRLYEATHTYINRQYVPSGQRYSRNNGSLANNPYTGQRYTISSGDNYTNYVYTATDNTTGTLYGIDNRGGYVELSSTTTTTVTWLLNGEVYTGARYAHGNTSTHIVKRITALYEASILLEFPIVGDDGTEYDGYSWRDTTGYFGADYFLVSLDSMPPANVTFIGSPQGNEKTIFYYVEVVSGESTDGLTLRTFNGKTFKLINSVAWDAAGLTYEEDYYPIKGFIRDPSYAEPYFGQNYIIYNGTYYATNQAAGTYGGWFNSYTVYSGRSDVAPVGSDTVGDYNVNYLYYQRATYKLEFRDSANNAPLSTIPSQILQYEKPFTTRDENNNITHTYKPTAVPVSTRPGYVFKGWYKDQGCEEPFDWDASMPDHDVIVYAGWEQLWYRIEVDPNGGELHGSESTFFWLSYGELIEEYGDISKDYVQDNGGEYYYHYHPYSSLIEYLPEGSEYEQPYEHPLYYSYWGRVANYDTVTTTAHYHYDPDKPNDDGTTGGYVSDPPVEDTVNFDANTKYRYEKGAYALVGWYEVNADGTLGKVYDFGTQVTKDIKIRAVWRRVGEYHVRYDAGDGTNGPTDSNTYADKSESAVLSAPTPPSGMVFVGWEYNGVIYKPGDVYQIDADLAVVIDGKKTVTLTAVYHTAEEEPVEVTSITIDGNGGTFAAGNDDFSTSNEHFEGSVGAASVSLVDLDLNTKVTLLGKNSFVRPGYVLRGWAYTANATSVDFAFDAIVGMDNLDHSTTTAGDDATNTLYAVWEQINVRIDYVPVGGGSVSPTTETIPAATGTASGSTATAFDGYTFVGWYDNEECEGNPLTTDASYVPSKNSDNIYEAATYYAKFEENTVTLHYEVVGPTGCGTVDPTQETVAVRTGEAQGSTATSSNADVYEFVGWYSEAACTNLLSEDVEYVQTKASSEMWVDGTTFYAKFVEKTVELNYVAVGPEGTTSGTDTYYVNPETDENLLVLTGTPNGSTAYNSNVFKFVGWYDNPECEGTPLTTNAFFRPTKADGELWVDGTTYYAKFEYNVTKLKITKTGMEAGENAVFTVTGKGIENGITVVVKNGETVVIDGVYVGEIYTITEIGGWTWKYTANATSVSKTIEAPPAENLVTFTNTLNNNHWLSGENRKTNVFKKATTTPAAG